MFFISSFWWSLW